MTLEAASQIATIILAAGVGFVFWQVYEARKTARKNTTAQIAIELFRELRKPESIDRLRNIYDNELDENQFRDSKFERSELGRNIDYILDRYDTLGNLVMHDIIDKEIAIETYAGTSALRVWYRLAMYIRLMGEERGYYATNFEDYVRKSYDYFKERDIKVWFRVEGQEPVSNPSP